MQSKVVRTLALVFVLVGGGMIAAQQPGARPGGPPLGPTPPKQKAPRKESKLEEMLAEALKNSPDIRVAAAKLAQAEGSLAQAEAELNRTRLQVTQQVATLYQSILSQKATVDYAEKRVQRMNGLLADRAIDSKMVEEEVAKLAAAKAKLAELEAQMPGLLGKSPHSEDDSLVRITARLALEPIVRRAADAREAELYHRMTAEVVKKPHKATGPMADRLRKALQTPVKVDYKNTNFDSILKDLAKKVPGLSFRNLAGAADSAETLNLRFEEALPVSAVLQALVDETNCRFYVREYGILATVKENMPPGALTVEEFLRQRPDDNEHKEARHFIYDVWPSLDCASLEDKIPAAQKAFQSCMDVGDRDSIRDMLGVTLGHVNRLRNRRSELHPELVIEHEKETKRLAKVGEKIAKLVADMQFCLKEWVR